MLRVKDILKEIEQYAPLPLQESFDNAGVQVGDVNQPATGALLCLDVTGEVVDEAIEMGCNLIVSHHPLAFKAFKSLTGSTYIERCMMKACKYDLVIYAAHTNLDNAAGGVNFRLAELIGLENVRVLSPQKGALLKLVTFVPEAYADLVRTTLFNAGAGAIGGYDSCSFSLPGSGTFRAGEGTNPFCGEIGELHVESEIRIETILPAFRKSTVTRALLSVHPYEEPVWNIVNLDNTNPVTGFGIIGELAEPADSLTFLQQVKKTFRCKVVRHTAICKSQIRKVAVCGGSGAFLTSAAIAQGADIYITGDYKYHDFFQAENRLILTDIGHYESEQFTKEIFYELVTKKISNFAIQFSKVETNPIHYL